jgi:hypothetical protein
MRVQGLFVALLVAALLATASARTLQQDELRLRALLDSDTDSGSDSNGATEGAPSDNFGLWEKDLKKLDGELKADEHAVDKALGSSSKDHSADLKKDSAALASDANKVGSELEQAAEDAGKGAKGVGAVVLCSLLLVGAFFAAVYKAFTMSQSYKEWSDGGELTDRSSLLSTPTSDKATYSARAPALLQ